MVIPHSSAEVEVTPVSYFLEYSCKQYCRKICGSDSGTAESLEGDAVSMGEWALTFWETLTE
jgi:hypothetical protein